MSDPVAKFKKVAWPHDLNRVSGSVDPHLARAIRRGQTAGSVASQTVDSAAETLSGGKALAESLLAPAPKSLAEPLYNGAQRVWSTVAGSRRLQAGLLGAAAITPILISAGSAEQQKIEDRMRHLVQEPGRDVMASLDSFLDRKAALSGREKSAASAAPWTTSHMMTGPQMGNTIANGFIGGIGSGLASGALSLVGGAIGGGIGALRDMFLTDRQRKSLFETVISNDIVLSDKIQQKPDVLEVLKEAYGSICRFAPSLSLDPNAVRSILREVAVGGQGMSYSVIKMLIETEKAHHDAHRA